MSRRRRQLAALFDLLDLAEPAPKAGDELPPLAHWLYFQPWGRTSETSESGDFLDPALPPIELPRRLCVESRITVSPPDPRRRSDLASDPRGRRRRAARARGADRHAAAAPRNRRRGRRGGLRGATPYLYGARRALETRRAADGPRTGANWSRAVPRRTPRRLFGYSALTRNISRVHYDRPFATFVEGHPGLVVQSDLVAALLLDLLREHAPAGARSLIGASRPSLPLRHGADASLRPRCDNRRRRTLGAKTPQARSRSRPSPTLDRDIIPLSRTCFGATTGTAQRWSDRRLAFGRSTDRSQRM